MCQQHWCVAQIYLALKVQFFCQLIIKSMWYYTQYIRWTKSEGKGKWLKDIQKNNSKALFKTKKERSWSSHFPKWPHRFIREKWEIPEACRDIGRGGIKLQFIKEELVGKAKPTVDIIREGPWRGRFSNLPASAMNMKHTKINTYLVNDVLLHVWQYQLNSLNSSFSASSSSADVVAKKKKKVFQSGLVRELIHQAATHSCARTEGTI